MNFIVNKARLFWEVLTAVYGTADKIESDKDCFGVKQWMKKVLKIFIGIGCAAIVMSSLIGILIMVFSDIHLAFKILIYVTFTCIFVICSFGFSALILHFDEVTKDVMKDVIAGYKVGSQFETTNYTLTQEGNNTYRIESHTSNDGLLYGAIFGIISYLEWAFFCAYLAPLLIFKRYASSKKALLEYKNSLLREDAPALHSGDSQSIDKEKEI